MRSVGLDLGSRKTTYCEVGNGQVVERATVRAVSDLVRLLGPNTPPANVAFEACREAWHVHEVLTGWGHRPLLIDTTRTKLIGIGQHKRKNDRIDAEVIALAVASGRIPQAHLLSPGRREIREQLEVRRALVETRAQYVTTIRGVVRSKEASALPSCKSRDFVAKLEATKVGEHTRALVGPLQSSLVTIEQQLEIVESRLEELCAREPIVLQLSTVPGVGRIVAASFVSVIDEAKRFHGAHQVEAYLGLVPGEDSTDARMHRHRRSWYARLVWCVEKRPHPARHAKEGRGMSKKRAVGAISIGVLCLTPLGGGCETTGADPVGRSESAILGARPCLPEPPEDRPRIPCDDFDGVPEAQDNCPWSYNPAQENCNLDAEREFGEAERGDRCDSRPCGATVVLPDRIEDFALRGVHVYDYRKIDIDGRVSGRESPTLRTGLRFCRCSVAEEDTVADRHACQFRQEDGSGGCTIGAIEEYREPQFREEDWRRITIIHHRPVPGTEIVVDGEVSGMEEAAVLYDYPSQVRPPIGDEELAALEFIRDVEIDWYFEDDVVRLGWSQDGLRIPWDVNGVLWTHTPGPLDGTYFPDQRRLLTSSYHSRSYGYEMIGNGADAAAGAVPIAPALLPSRRCALCAADFPSPWLMAEPCGGPSSCGDAPEIRFSEGFLDAASFFAPGTAAVLGAAGPWVAASEPMAFLVEDGVRFAAVASDGTSIEAALASSPLGFEALISPPSPGSPPTDLAAEAAGDGTGRGGRGHAAGWRNRPPPRRDFGIALSATEDRLWIVGGVDESGTPVGDLWSFNFRSRTWRRHTLTSTERPGRVLAAAFDPYLGALAVLDLVVQGATETVRLLRMDLPAPWVEVLASWERAGARTTFAMSSVPSGSGYAVACGDPSSHGVLYVSRDPGGVRITGHRQGPGPLASSLLRAEVPGVSLLVEEPDGRAFPVGYSWADLLGADGEAAGLCF